jgi:hypothetical protein
LDLTVSRVFLDRVTSGYLPPVLGLRVRRNRHWNRASGDPWRIGSSSAPFGLSLSDSLSISLSVSHSISRSRSLSLRLTLSRSHLPLTRSVYTGEKKKNREEELERRRKKRKEEENNEEEEECERAGGV